MIAGRSTWIDATYVKTREGGRIVSTAAIIAVGVNIDGRREVLGVATGASEAEVFWKGFLRSLAGRGLRGDRLVIADASRERAPKLTGLMDEARDRVLAYTAFPRALAADRQHPSDRAAQR